MMNTQPTAFVGPCGDCACEKYADCAYCGTCTPPEQIALWEQQREQEYLWAMENEMSFGEWLASR